MERAGAIAGLIAALALSACAGGRPVAGAGGTELECAPYARALTGVQLSGPAAGWWVQAQGRYPRTHAPAKGDILVFARSARLPYGHVAVVAAVVAPRRVLLDQANWWHGHIGTRQPAVDASAAGDWSLVRVWWPPAAALGTALYPALGFIRPGG